MEAGDAVIISIAGWLASPLRLARGQCSLPPPAEIYQYLLAAVLRCLAMKSGQKKSDKSHVHVEGIWRDAGFRIVLNLQPFV